MKPWGNRSGLALWNVCILGLLLVGCSSSDFSSRSDYRPSPSISEEIEALKNRRKAAPKGSITVQRGDSLYVLARRHGVPLRGLIQANRLKPPYIIYPGQYLKLPLSHYHVVSKGETVYQISRQYDVDMGSLVRINGIEPPYRVVNGQQLRLPDRRPSIQKAVVRSPAASNPTDRSGPAPKLIVARTPGPVGESLPSPPKPPRWNKSASLPIKTPPARSGRKFLWPLQGKVIVSFGARDGGLHNDGINIAAREGASIRAAENGVVAYTGNQLQGFGNLVLLKHAGGWMSAYAHSSVILVKRGDVVRRGQTIARVGRTGNVSRPQLHFELRRGEHAVNPRKHLVRIARLEDGLKKVAGLMPGGR